jgi:small subunit ribosomal protein S20
MANNPGAKKAIRKIARRTEVNKARRSRVRTFLRRFEEALTGGDAETARTAFIEAQSELMRACVQGRRPQEHRVPESVASGRPPEEAAGRLTAKRPSATARAGRSRRPPLAFRPDTRL